MGLDILSKEGQDFVITMLDIANRVNEIQTKKYKYPHNVEQIPAESCAVKLSEADKLLGYNKNYDIYSNQFIPLVANADIYDRIKLQGLFDQHMTGGAICHLNIADQITDVKFVKKLTKKAAKEGVVYFAFNYNLQECKKGCITVGKNEKCNKCGSEIIENYTRVVGFLVPTSNWTKKRRELDYPNRVFYEEKNIKNGVEDEIKN
jgi:ribonucleoside-triphosphate reductase